MENKMNYVAPEIEVVDVAVEQGFAGSVGVGDYSAFEDGGGL